MSELPRVARWLLTVFLPVRFADEIVGDMEELYRQRLRTASRLRAVAWVWWRTVTLIPGILFRGWLRRLAGLLSRPDPGSAHRAGVWDGVIQEVRVAIRAVTRSPGFTAVALASLTLGIAVNAIVFSVIDAAFRPLPFPDAGRLMDVHIRMVEQERTRPPLHGEFRAWREAVGSESGNLIAYQARWTLLEGVEGVSDEVVVGAVSREFLELLGAGVTRGRMFTAADYRADATPVALVSHEFWNGALGRDPNVLGREIQLNGIRYTIVGVVEPRFAFESVPISAYTAMPPIGIRGAEADDLVDVMVRLGDEVTPEQFVAELQAVEVGETGELDGAREREVPALQPIKEALYGWTWKRFGPFMGVVAFTLLLVSANLANLALVRAKNRGREVAVRKALGAGRWRLLRQVGAEMLVLTTAANAFALVLASWGIRMLIRLNPLNVTNAAPRFDLRVALFATSVALFAAALAALWPALSVMRTRVGEGLQQSAGQVTGSRRHQLVQRGLVVIQIAGSLVLLAGAGLLTKTNLQMHRFESGIETRNLLRAYISVLAGEEVEADEDESSLFIDQLIQRSGSVPAVTSVAAATAGGSLLREMTETAGGITLEGRSERLPEALLTDRGSYGYVSAEYFRTLGIRIMRGRGLVPSDFDGSAPPVAVLNEEAARRWWPEAGVDVVGRRFKMGPPGADTPWITVIGVVENTRSYYLQLMDRPTAPQVRLPLTRTALGSTSLYLRTTGSPLDEVLPPLRAALKEVHAGLRLRLPTYLDDLRQRELAYYSVNGQILLAFALFGLLLAAMGIWGVVAYRVARRTREIGLRKALGAGTGRILSTVTQESLIMTVIGIGLGLALSSMLTRVLDSMLFGVSHLDPSVYAIVSVFLALVVGIATYLPARRAIVVDPATALRTD